MVRSLKQKISREIHRVFRRDATTAAVPAVLDEDWIAERRYWHDELQEFYRTQYGLKLHPAQSDSTLTPVLEKTVQIQRPEKANPDVFLASGYRGALDYQTELLDYNASVDKMQNILEMGVGFGRQIVHFFPFNAQLFGCDVTPDAVEWTRLKLSPRVDVALTNLEPPLPYADSMFDFVYATSVFTHVPCSLMDKWACELRRVIRPGGFLIFTVFDANHYFRDLSYREFHRELTKAGCRDWDQERGVHMTTYLSRDYIRSTWGNYFRILEIRSHYRDQSHVICQRDD